MSAEVPASIFEMFIRNDNKALGQDLAWHLYMKQLKNSEANSGNIRVREIQSFVVALPLTQEDSLNEVKGK
ncbi:MAG: hypothetical protein IPJ20_14905 [Flammeovirgaceae bacterium]|nr:hypothetical protein [Flammeovirgaceae bacterium]